MPLLTALSVKNSHMDGWNLLYHSRKRPRPNLKGFQYLIGGQWKDWDSSYQERQIFALFSQIRWSNFSCLRVEKMI